MSACRNADSRDLPRQRCISGRRGIESSGEQLGHHPGGPDSHDTSQLSQVEAQVVDGCRGGGDDLLAERPDPHCRQARHIPVAGGHRVVGGKPDERATLPGAVDQRRGTGDHLVAAVDDAVQIEDDEARIEPDGGHAAR